MNLDANAIEAPTVDEHGFDVHPAWAVLGASRIQSNPGQVLFDSDIVHANTVRIRLMLAVRKRDLHHDWIHGSKIVVEVEMSESQWASFVSTMNSGDGVPCTLRFNAQDGYVPGFPHEPQLAETMRETHEAAEQAFEAIREAFAAVEAAKTPASKRDAMDNLRAKINNATPNVDFAGKQLVKQSEDVVNKAKADVEAWITTRARQLGLEAGSYTLALPGGNTEGEDDAEG